MAYNGIEQQAIALFFLKLNWLATPTYDLSAVCSLQYRTALRSFLSQSLSSTPESDGQFSSPQRVPPLRAPLLVRPLLVLLSQYLPSRVFAPIR